MFGDVKNSQMSLWMTERQTTITMMPAVFIYYYLFQRPLCAVLRVLDLDAQSLEIVTYAV